MSSRSRVIAAVAGILVVLGIAAIGTVASANADSSSSGGRQPVVFNFAFLSKPDSLNPYTGIAAESYDFWYLMYPTITTPSQRTLASQPALATSWSHSADGLTWTFHLRKGVVWSDGRPLTSADVAFNLSSIIDGGVQASTWGSYIKNVTSVTAPDLSTVVLHLSKPNVGLPFLPMPIVPKHIWGGFSNSETRSFKNGPPNVVGAGPFIVSQADPTLSTVTFVRNPRYYGPRPNIDKIVFTTYKQQDAAVQALTKGEVDFVEGVSGLTAQRLEGDPNITTHLATAPGFDEIAFNTGSVNLKTGAPMGDPNPAVLDPAFRHALSYAVDQRVLISKVYQGLGAPAASVIPDGFPYQWRPPPAMRYHFDLAKAGQLLDAAGYTMGSDGKRDLPNGDPIGTLRLFARSDSPTSTGTMDYFKEWLAALGIDSEVTVMSGEKLTDVILDGDFDTFQWGWLNDPDPDSILSYFTCAQRGGWSDSWFCNQRYDAMYEAQHTELDSAKRAVILDRMQRMLYLQSPYIVTTYGATGEAYRSDRFTGFSPQPAPDGVYFIQFGPYNYVHAQPIDGGGTLELAALETHNRLAFLYVVCGAALVVILGSLLVSWRRAQTVDDRP